MGGMTEPERAAAEQVPLHEVALGEAELRASIARAHAPLDLRGIWDESGKTAASLSRVPVDGTSNTASAGHAAKVSAAKGLVEVRRRTGRPIPDEVLQLAEQG